MSAREGDTIAHSAKVTVALALAVIGVVGSVALAAGRVMREIESMSKLVEIQGAALQELSIKVVRLEESLRVYQAWPSQPSK